LVVLADESWSLLPPDLAAVPSAPAGPGALGPAFASGSTG